MDINAILEPFMEQCPRIAELDDAAQSSCYVHREVNHEVGWIANRYLSMQ